MPIKLCSRETKTLNIADYKVHLIDTKIDHSFNYQTWRKSFIVCTETKGCEKKRPLELQSTNQTISKIQTQHFGWECKVEEFLLVFKNFIEINLKEIKGEII